MRSEELPDRVRHFDAALAPPGRPLAPGDRKLYPLIEGPTERVVKEGKSYVKNIIEGIIAKQALPGAAGQPQGRYRV